MKINLGFLFKKQYLILYLIILVGSFLRMQGIFTNSFAFTYDAGRDMLALWDMLNMHKFSLIGPTTGLPGVFYGPWWYLILLPFYAVSGGNPQGLTFSIALFGILTIIFAFLFGKKLGGNLLGYSFAGIISVSSAFTSLSNQIWSPNIAPIFIILVLLILYKIYSEKIPKAKYFFFLGFLLALISELGIVFGILFLVGIFLSILVIFNRKISLKLLLSSFLGVIVIFSPRIFFEFRHQFLMSKSFLNYAITSSSSQSANIFELFINRLNILFNQFSSTIALENKILGFLIALFIIFSIITFFKKTEEIYKKFIKTSLIVILTFLIGLTFFKHDIWSHYLVGLPVLYLLSFSISINLMFKKTNNILISSLILLTIVLINLNLPNLIGDINKPIWIGDASVYRNQLEVLDYVYKESKGKDFKYVVYTPPVHDYTYRYLFKWYGPTVYHYSPKNISQLAYFILEPDLQYPSRLKDWLNSREKDGKIVKTKIFKSGIIVQTRTNQ